MISSYKLMPQHLEEHVRDDGYTLANRNKANISGNRG
jgi:hypothetical protein